MFKQLALLALASSLAISLVSGELACKDVQQVSFEEMQKPGNICHFLHEKGEQMNSLTDYGKVETCTCNLLNKDFTWVSMMTPEVKTFHSQVVQRLELGNVGIPYWRRMMPLKKDLVLDILVNGPKSLNGVFQPDIFPEEEVKKSCQAVMGGFGKSAHLFDNLDHFVGHRLFKAEVIRRAPILAKLLTVYTVCKILDY